MQKKINKLKKKLMFTCFGLLISANTAFGAPSVQDVNGVISDGEKIIVTGVGLGAHDDYDGGTPYINYLFEDCEAGMIDKASKNWSGAARMVTSDNKQGSQYNAFHRRDNIENIYINIFGETVTNSNSSTLVTNVNGVSPIHNYFFSEWIRFSPNFNAISSDTGCQVKLLMDTAKVSGRKVYFQTRGSSPPPLRTETENGLLSKTHGDLESYMPYGTWHRLDIWVSIPDETTGGVDEYKFWVDGKLIREGKHTDGGLTPNPEDVYDLLYISFIGYMSNPQNEDYSVQTDDHFVDFTMARVEICDNPTWDDTVQKHCELQLPTSWTDSSLEFEANISSFSDGTPLYLYVVDATGIANSSGFLLGRETTTPVPTKPAVVEDFSSDQ